MRLVATRFIPTKKRIKNFFEDENISDKMKNEWIFLVPLLAIIPIACVALFFILGDFSSFYLHAVIDDPVLFFGFFKCPIEWAIPFVSLYLYLGFWFFPSCIFAKISKKEWGTESDTERFEKKVFLLTGISFTPLLIFFNISLAYIATGEEFLHDIDSAGEIIILIGVLLGLFNYCFSFVNLAVYQKTGKDRIIHGFLYLILILIFLGLVLGGFYL